jgi:hypothetical protein
MNVETQSVEPGTNFIWIVADDVFINKTLSKLTSFICYREGYLLNFTSNFKYLRVQNTSCINYKAMHIH